LFKKYYNKNLKSSSQSKEFLNDEINFMPYLFALRISKTILINSFSQSTKITDTFLFLKYGTESMIKKVLLKIFYVANSSYDSNIIILQEILFQGIYNIGYLINTVLFMT
jgi:hypothetical protein